MQNKTKTFLFFWVLFFIFSSVLLYKYFFPAKYVSPIGTGKVLSMTDSLPSEAEVIGFLPYWNLKKEPYIDFSVLDQIIYFGLTAGDDGSIVKNTEDGYEEPGWTWFRSESLEEIKNLAHAKNKKVLFSVNAFDNQLIESILSNSKYQQALTENIIFLLNEHEFDGVNIDFEYTFSADKIYPQKQSYTKFIELLRKELDKQQKNYLLSADFYANAMIYENMYDISAVSDPLDHVIIMAYDFYRAQSSNSGPVAPLKSVKGKSIIESVQASFAKVPKEKIVLGIPLYGYEWQTYSEEPGSSTVPNSGALASYQRVHKLIEDQTLKVSWDDTAMCPFLVYKLDGATKQIYFENLESLSYKYQLVKQLKLGGVAFWAIGYEGEFKEVWAEVGSKLKS